MIHFFNAIYKEDALMKRRFGLFYDGERREKKFCPVFMRTTRIEKHDCSWISMTANQGRGWEGLPALLPRCHVFTL